MRGSLLVFAHFRIAECPRIFTSFVNSGIDRPGSSSTFAFISGNSDMSLWIETFDHSILVDVTFWLGRFVELPFPPSTMNHSERASNSGLRMFEDPCLIQQHHFMFKQTILHST